MYVPEDYENPDFEWRDNYRGKNVHEWRCYINVELAAIWHTFSNEQKRIIAKNAQDVASNEEWD